MTFSFSGGVLHVEHLPVVQLLDQGLPTPFYLYSAAQLRRNVRAYQAALDDIPGVPGRIHYALKANHNLTLLRLLREMGCHATTVSGNEIRIALAAGFRPEQILFHGNGKTDEERAFAVDQGVLISIDSLFDLEATGRAAQNRKRKSSRLLFSDPHSKSPAADRPVEILLRLNPDLDPQVHPYIATGRGRAKFGIPPAQLPELLERLRDMPHLRLTGLHVHLGSTISDLAVFRAAAAFLARLWPQIAAAGFSLTLFNLGGGLGLAPHPHGDRPGDPAPTPAELLHAIMDLVPPKVTLLLEPGRSIVGDAGILVCRVLGVKETGQKKFIVIDGSMAELIRPALYGAHHEIAFIEPVAGEVIEYDVVGPVCESADFLGQDRRLPPPPAGTGIAVFQAGAYGYAMSSNYNARLRPSEYLVDGDQFTQIRRPEQLSDLLALMTDPGRSGS